MALFKRKPKPGQVFDGPVCYCYEEDIVPFPGHYGIKKAEDGSDVPDPSIRLKWDDTTHTWRIR